MSRTLQPSGSWVRIDVITGGVPTTRQSAARPWPDAPGYFDGYKLGEVTAFGDTRHALSDHNGSPNVSRFSFEVFDRDGYWRDLLTTRPFLSGQDVTYYLASAQAHDTEADPRLGFRGQILTPSPLPGRKFRVEAESRIGTKWGPFNLDGPVLKRAFTTTDFPNIPRELANTAVPFLWGEESDEGTTNAAGDDVATGMVIPTYCGFLAGASPTYALPPTNLRVTIYGATRGDRIPTTIGVTFFTVNGQTTATVITEADYPLHPAVDDGALIEWDDPNADGVVIAARVFLGDAPLPPTHGLDTLNNGGTYVDPEESYDHNGISPGDDDRYKSRLPPPPSVNTAVIGTGTDAREFFCLLGHPGTITAIYASDLQETAAYAKVSASEIGTGNYFDLGPDETGYLVTINGHDYWGFFARGPKADAHKTGSMPFRVNLCGWNDDYGLLIDRAAYVYQDVFVQLQGNGGQGFQTGARLLIPSFQSSPTVPILQSTTFEAVQDQGALEMGTLYGPLATVYLNSFDTTWRSFEQEMNRSFFWDSGEQHHGQTMLAAMRAIPDPTTGTMFREFIDILRVEDAGVPAVDEIENVIRYQFDKHPIEGEFRSGILTIKNGSSIEGYGERKADSTRDLIYTRDAATARWSADRYLADRSIAPQYPAIVTKFRKALSVTLGEQIRVEHSDIGDGTTIAVYVREKVASTTRGEVRLMGRLRISTYAPGFEDEEDPEFDGFLLGDEESSEPPPVGAYQLSLDELAAPAPPTAVDFVDP